MEKIRRIDGVEVPRSATFDLERYREYMEMPTQTPSVPGLKARLDKKTGRKVLCGRIECDGLLARIRHRYEADFARINAAIGDVYGSADGEIDYVEFPPGGLGGEGAMKCGIYPHTPVSGYNVV